MNSVKTIKRNISRSGNGTMLHENGSRSSVYRRSLPDWIEIPDTGYSVEYTLEKDGELVVICRLGLVGVVPLTAYTDSGSIMCACFLPSWWENMRVTRTVLT